MRHPIDYTGTYPGSWNGYKFKEPLDYTTGVHTGVDYNWGSANQDLGKPVYAIVGGKVVGRKENGQVSGLGNAVIIETDNPPVAGTKLYHRYLHMQSVSVSVGQTVTEGQQIGTVGNTSTTYAHLHLDVWTNRNGLGAHWNYDKNTQLASYEDAFYLIERNKSWTGGSDMADVNDVKAIYKLGPLGRDADQAGINTYTGKKADFILTDHANSAEGKARIAAVNKALTEAPEVPVLRKKVTDLTDALGIKDNEIKRLNEQLLAVPGDTELLNGFGAWLAKLIARLGIKK